MAEFDPDAYLKEAPPEKAFNPDEYLKDTKGIEPMGAPEDMARSAGSGLVSGLTGMAAMNSIAQAMHYAPQMARLGAQKADPTIPDKKFAPSPSEQINRDFGGEYKPQTTAGKYTKSIAEVAPAGLTGPAGLLRKGAETALSGAGAELLGSAAEGTAWETPARIAGSVLGPHPVGRAVSLANNIQRVSRTPSAAQLFRISDHQFDTARQTGAIYDPFRTQQLQGTIERALDDAGHDTQAIGNVLRSVNRLTDSQLPSFGNLLGVRSRLNKIAQQRDPVSGRATEPAQAARTSIDHIDDFLGDAQNAWMHGPNPAQNMRAVQTAVEHVADARGNWNAGLRDAELSLATRKGLNNAAGEGSGTNIDNRLRQQMRNLANNPSKIGKFDAETQAGIQDIIRGDTPRNAARLLGKLAGTHGVVPAALLIGLAHSMGFGIPATMAAGAVGYGAKKLADNATQNHILRVRESLRAASPHGQSMNIPDRLSPYREGVRSPVNLAHGIPQHAPKPPLSARQFAFPAIEGVRHGFPYLEGRE